MSNLSSIILAGHSVHREICFTAAWQHACRLADATPELLACLRRYVDWQQGHFDTIDIEEEMLHPAQSAIAKAEGREA